MQIRSAAALALAAVTLVALPGCNDSEFLTEEPIDFVGPGNFYRNQGDALAALTAVYAAFINDTRDGYYGRNFWMLAEYPTETLTSGRLSGTNERSRPDNFTHTPSHAYLLTVWSSAYQAINRANAVIDNVPGIDMDAALRDRIVAEAKFLRALHYFNLVRMWGGVPLRLQETRGLEDTDAVRATAAEVYDQIVADLTDAINGLPPASAYGSADQGRASSGAAKALLGRVYLQRGATGVGSSADFASAQEILQEIVGSGEYGLVDDYRTLFDVYGGMLDEDNEEIIFAIQNARSPGLGGRMSSHMAPNNTAPYLGSSTNGSVGAELSFFNSYALDDARREGAFLLSWDRGGTIVSYVPNGTNSQNAPYGAHVPFPRKYLDPLMTGGGTEEPDYIILRYADVLLMLAEAMNEVSGPTLEAQELVNMVRNRAGLADLDPTLVASYDAFKDAIFQERRWELVAEGHGHFDSQRHWEWAKARIEANLAAGREPGAGNRYPRPTSDSPTELTDQFLLYPIPQRVIDVSPGITQNPGWGGGDAP